MSDINPHPSQPKILSAMDISVDNVFISLGESSRRLAVIPQSLIDIAVNLATQDNRITSDPIFLVQKKVRQTGMDLDYCDRSIWLDCANDGDEVTDLEQIERLNELEEKYPLSQEEKNELGDYLKTGYIDHWETVQPFFTEKAARQFVESNAHRYDPDSLRIYVDSAYRNPEWQAVRNFLLSLVKMPGFVPENKSPEETGKYFKKRFSETSNMIPIQPSNPPQPTHEYDIIVPDEIHEICAIGVEGSGMGVAFEHGRAVLMDEKTKKVIREVPWADSFEYGRRVLLASLEAQKL